MSGGMLAPFFAVLRRDLTLAWRGRADVLVTLAFFVLVVCLFPFGVGPETNQLRAIAPKNTVLSMAPGKSNSPASRIGCPALRLSSSAMLRVSLM